MPKFKRFRLCLTTALTVVVINLCAINLAFSQEAVEIKLRDAPIPREHYKSWSLFLICNPVWALPESREKVLDLYDRFKAFGDAIGPEHAAVWFWAQDPRGSEVYDSLDVMRSAAFCSRLKFLPSEGPFILVTTQYPGEGLLNNYPDSFPEALGNHSLIKLNGVESNEIMQVLTDISDKLFSGNINDIDSDSEEYWLAWKVGFEAVRGGILNVSRRVKISISTSFFETEVEL